MWLVTERFRFFANQSRCWILRSHELIRLVENGLKRTEMEAHFMVSRDRQLRMSLASNWTSMQTFFPLPSKFSTLPYKYLLVAFTTTAMESETVNPVRALSPLSPSSSFISKQLYAKPSHSDDHVEQIKAVVDILLKTITASSKSKLVLYEVWLEPWKQAVYKGIY